MNNQLRWLKSLPVLFAIRMIALFAVRKFFRIPVAFSYSQGAEDLIADYYLRYLFDVDGPGTYVDVGCNWPVRYSNTFDLYLRGWRGINIDANQQLIDECWRVRKQDISICAAVSDSEQEVTFHKAEGGLMSTLDPQKFEEWKDLPTFARNIEVKVVTKTLTSILDANLPNGRSVDLLTIDVEGHDFQVLKGLDLNKYRPQLIIIEIHALDSVKDNEIYKYLTANGYLLKAFAIMSAYFVDEQR